MFKSPWNQTQSRDLIAGMSSVRSTVDTAPVRLQVPYIDSILLSVWCRLSPVLTVCHCHMVIFIRRSLWCSGTHLSAAEQAAAGERIKVISEGMSRSDLPASSFPSSSPASFCYSSASCRLIYQRGMCTCRTCTPHQKSPECCDFSAPFLSVCVCMCV